MRLDTLFGPHTREMWTSKSKFENIDLDIRFKGLVNKYNLELFKGKDGLLMANDESGQILYKKVLDYEWFQWKPFSKFSIKDLAEYIYNIQ